MRIGINLAMAVVAMSAFSAQLLQGQDSKINTNLGMGMTVPV